MSITTPQPYDVGDKTSFAFETTRSRLPAILKQIINDFKQQKSKSTAGDSERVNLIKKFEFIHQQLLGGAELEPLPTSLYNVQAYNSELKRWNESRSKPVSYAEGPWLFIECFFFRSVQLEFDQSEHWKRYDMFAVQKESAFRHSKDAVCTLAARAVQIFDQLAETKDELLRQNVLKTTLRELIQSSLWGNATDLALFVSMTPEEIKKVQVKADERHKDFLLADDFENIWRKLAGSPGGRVDIILDNAGFEVYTDMVLALALLTSGLAEQIIIHPKSQPWFVSDVTPFDWIKTTQLMSDPGAFPEEREALDKLVSLLQHYENEGQIVLRPSQFWTTPYMYSELNPEGRYGGKEIWSDLRASKLALFKGDLNYRKLTGDATWPSTTPFETALGTLDKEALSVASLRTVKSDVVVGLKAGVVEKLDENWAKTTNKDQPFGWRWSGQYAVISFHGA